MDERFHRAARDGYLDKLREANRKEVNQPDEDGNTPTHLAAQYGNLDALRLIIMRGGDPDKMNLLGYSALHHAVRNGHINCVSFLVNFGANVWVMDNDFHMPLDIAALENREDIVKFLDEAQSVQMRKSPKIAQELKEKALKVAEKNAKHYEEVQEKASRKLAKDRRRNEMIEAQQNGDFKAPSDASVFKKLTLKFKGTKKGKPAGDTQLFSEVAQGSRKKSGTQKVASSHTSAELDFKVSETDDTGKRTLRSVRGTIQGKDRQVLYVRDDINIDPSSRPALTNVFPETSIKKAYSQSNSDPNLVDSGNESIGEPSYGEDDEQAPGIFSRPNFGNISFLNKFDYNESFKSNPKASFDDIDSVLHNGDVVDDEDNTIIGPRSSSGAASSSTGGSIQDLPWKEDDVEVLDDDEEETEYTKVMMFLESCGLTRYTHLFTSSEVDMEALLKLTQEDFKEIGLPVGPRRKLLDAIENRKQVLSSPSAISDTFL